MDEPLDAAGFALLIGRVAAAWSALDTDAAVRCFTEDAIYMQPPDVQFYQGAGQLARYFGALQPGTYLRLEHVWFNADEQLGCAEFTFGREGRPAADHGVLIARCHDGKIAHWREYVIKGPPAQADFLAAEGKAWQWHIGNYP